ncbi:hypothetical protein Pan265_04740 [Mucisphaera calidilacus]|uniref:Uncharacterized protein n=1 Tax=Mucisphaera calidilacus TaxID=2527982 RepID=A0A518BUN9_9BACT|nr:hypothetical protein Pan265_04740 [Mucisphaera calidilacus]
MAKRLSQMRRLGDWWPLLCEAPKATAHLIVRVSIFAMTIAETW